jgi:hypothetical protein
VFKFFLIVTLLVSGAAVLFSIYVLWTELKFSRVAEKRVGKIIRYADMHSGTVKVKAPVVEWIGHDGVSRQFLGDNWPSRKRKRHIAGSDIAILLGVDKSKLRVCIDDFFVRYGGALALGLLFSIVFVLVVFLFQRLSALS